MNPLTRKRHLVHIHDMRGEDHFMAKDRHVVEDCACQKVRMAARAVTRAYDAALRPVGLRATQLAVVVAFSVDGAISITALAKVMGMDRSTLTRNLGPLEKEGLIAVGLEGRHRSRTLAITRQGLSRLREAMPLWERAQDTLREKLGDANWVGVHESLDRLIGAA
jgi:DNA-binding MarR family transcriptional regulator